MDRSEAKKISRLLASAAESLGATYSLKKNLKGKSLDGFHQWVDGRPCEGAYFFADHEGDGLWILFIDWRIQGSFYLILFPESRSTPLAEIHRLTIENGEKLLHWRYSPSKRDGRNDERRSYFVDAFLSDHVKISVPEDVADVSDFVEELFSLATSRKKADELDPDRPNVRSGFPEGKLKERLHYSRERNRELVRQAKLLAQRRDGCLQCECCGFDFFAIYGKVGEGFIEAHHTKPISSLHENGEETRIEDLVLVCSNCHQMLHRKRPWLEIDDLAALLAANSKA